MFWPISGASGTASWPPGPPHRPGGGAVGRIAVDLRIKRRGRVGDAVETRNAEPAHSYTTARRHTKIVSIDRHTTQKSKPYHMAASDCRDGPGRPCPFASAIGS